MSKRQKTGVALSVFIVAFCFTPWFQQWVNFPEELRIVAGTPHHLQMPLPFGLSMKVDKAGLLINDLELTPEQMMVRRGQCAILSSEPGRVNLEFRLFGLLPLRKLNVQVLPPIKVVPSGHSIGVTIQATTMVVGHGNIKTANGVVQPGKEAGLRLGDLIIAVDDHRDPTVVEVAEAIDKAGKTGRALSFLVKRSGQEQLILVQPALCQETKRFRIGVYVRDDAAGVGTMTFVDRESKTFGALGHIISDVDTNQALEVRDGKVMRSRVTSIDQGRSGHPGEKRSIIIDEDNVVGQFTINTGIGIFGDLVDDITKGGRALPVALVDEVQPGKAEILTVIEGEKVDRFEIEIVRVIKQYSPSGKGMVIRVTDQRLLSKTGGIVQGMSGSPIIQNNKLVGSVTHVFVNKPDSGYGVFAEWMVRESGMLEKREQTAPTFFYRKYLRQAAGL